MTGGPSDEGDVLALPAVVGVPTVDFAPRPPCPPEPGDYRPDTVCDAWSAGRLTVRMASVRGYAHRYDGTPRQDDAVAVAHPGSGAVVFAVADGVSAAGEAHVGAALACRAAVRVVLRSLDDAQGDGDAIDWDAVDWDAVVGAAAAALVRDAGDDKGAAAARFATTLVTGLVRPEPPAATLVRVGDTAAWRLRGGAFEALTSAPGDPVVVRSATAALPVVPDVVRPQSVDLAPGDVVLVGTDGFGDPLGDGTGQVGRLVAEVLATPPSALRFAHVLDFSRETFDDDRTLLAIWSDPDPPC
ncbi:protein phosphatase 2C domain-containing protein [Cryptosporangium aurantiacum]|uniref:Protein phosphatase 2C n=1 Tax=Cryptosporangium aurantiacum TaxID=134849 RepID=A0A1M7RLR8_9ACTN|nr:protein phosphatase 2C domain-containing protein [Cryptosporangium aurantiacum]SHN47120.1 Protein phosphatase 2C [Cryptosporangium aurantiacum]